MTRKEISKQAIQVYNKVINYYGESKYHDTLPDINLESKIHPKYQLQRKGAFSLTNRKG
jgi:hypothetical protein